MSIRKNTKKYYKNIKMYILKPGYPSTWVKVCNGFTYKNINKYRTKDSHVKFKNSYWILRGNNILDSRKHDDEFSSPITKSP